MIETLDFGIFYQSNESTKIQGYIDDDQINDPND